MDLNMTKDEALDLALEALEYHTAQTRPIQRTETAITAIKQARSASVQDIDWKDMYEKEKRRSEMWAAKYEKDIGPLEYAVPVAEPVQEPVAWADVDENGAISSLRYWSEPDNRYEVALYPAPPAAVVNQQLTTEPAAQRQWVPLTDAEVMQTMSGDWTSQFYFARAIEAKFKEKNT
jgi:hypothetical protein